MKQKLKKLLASWNESLGLRLSVFIMLITMALFAMTIGIAVFQADETTVENTIRSTESQMANTVQLVNNTLYGVEKTVKNYAVNAKYRLTTKESCYSFCEEMLRNDSTIFTVTIMFRHDYFKDLPAGRHLFAPFVTHELDVDSYLYGNLVAAGDDDFQYEKTDSNWIGSNLRDGGYWCPAYQDMYQSRSFLVTYSYPIHDKEGNIYAVLCADIRLSWLSESVTSLRPTAHSRIMMLGSDDRFIVHPVEEFYQATGSNLLAPRLDQAIGENDVDTTIVSLYKEMKTAQKGIKFIDKTRYFSMNNKTDTIPEGFVLFSRVDATGWSIAAVCPQSDIDAQSNDLVRNMMLSSFVGLVLMALALLFMVRKMVLPYKKFASVDADIKTAAHIQETLISKVFPTKEQLKGKQLFASMTPAKSIGGDLYDYYLDGENLTFIVGDVSGKGVPAAFFMSSALTLFRTFTRLGQSPSQIVTAINNSLSDGNDTMMFVTMFVGRLNLSTGKTEFCNGGHNAPVLIHENNAEFIKMQTNLPVGVMEGMPYAEETLLLSPGDTFVVYSDGVTEAEDVAGTLYSDGHLLKFLSGKNFESPEKLCTRLLDDVRQHAGEAEQSDDITMLGIMF